MTVEQYILEGICCDCDQDPTQCHLQGYCEYDGPDNNESDLNK